MSWVVWLVSFLGRFVMSLRYRVEVRELTPIPKGLKKTLFLPNHPAYIDPAIGFFYLWNRFRFRPVVAEYVARMPGVSWFIQKVGGVPIPSLDASVNQLKILSARRAIQKIVGGLHQGDNFVIYPGGSLKATSKENLGGASGTQEILQSCEGVSILLIRTTGLWGSRFSRGFWHGRYPQLWRELLRGAKTLLQNGIFFTPRRKVVIELSVAPPDFPRNGSRLEVNRYLENWYNQKEDPLTLVPTHFWDRTPPRLAEKEVFAPKQNGNVAIPQEIQEAVAREIRRLLDAPEHKISLEMSLSKDLGMDSLNIAELIIFLTNQYDLQNIHPDQVETVEEVCLAAVHQEKKSQASAEKQHLHQWAKEGKRPTPFFPEGKTFPEVFLNGCSKMGSAQAIADDIAGILSYKKLKMSALVLSRSLAQIPEKNIAVMLPASVGAYVVILALHLAGKVPVMLNWTLGPKYLEEMMKLAEAKTILSSWRFLDRLSYVDFGATVGQIVFLEDVRKGISLKMKLKGLFLSFCPPKLICRVLGLHQIDPDSPAVILFTSGTEAVPKGVPLSHDNILSNLRSGLRALPLASDDIFYGVLPPFHSFGFGPAGLYPIFIGMRAVFYADPKDAVTLAQDIDHWKVTYTCFAPSFLKGLFSVAKREQLLSVRYFVTGAEKTPPELYTKVAEWKLPAEILEGYGVTEGSPGVSINRHNIPARGVGKLMDCSQLCTIHPETSELLAPGAPGEICLRGSNIFHGYLGNVSSPFITIQNQQWYRTGDVGYLDPDGFLILTDRLKRFIKIGGEMISLGVIEDALSTQLKVDRQSLAVVEGAPGKLFLFTTFPLDKDKANETLFEYGLSRLIKVFAVQQVAELPVLGTGKMNYRQLKTLCN